MKFRSLLVLWPSFVVAGILNSLFFALFDPLELTINGELIFTSRMVAYSVGFFICWIFTAISSGLTLFFERDSTQVNRYCALPVRKAEAPQDDAHLVH
ncbi:hypothetical protein [Chitinimonas sp.]|uniref:hypothetical protein n=1 Tax=Chitinimonas sp. TaxID=1934313 RepID=UPI0035AE2E7F